MKKYLAGLAFLVIFQYSCTKESTKSQEGIPGMGNTPGDLEVQGSFIIPPGITILGEISPLARNDRTELTSKSTDNSETITPTYGSGNSIDLKLTLYNANDSDRTIFFPKGLLWQCNSVGCHNGILLQTTWITLPARSSKTIDIYLYCINYYLPHPKPDATYKIIGVTSSAIIENLLTLIDWRKINYEMVKGNSGKAESSSGPAYGEICDRLQNIIWNLTDFSIGISDEDMNFIESIPGLSVNEIPGPANQLQFPLYFKEFVIRGN